MLLSTTFYAGIVGSTTGSNYYVRVLSTINRELLKPNSSVALHRHSNGAACPRAHSRAKPRLVRGVAVRTAQPPGWGMTSRGRPIRVLSHADNASTARFAMRACYDPGDGRSSDLP